MGTGNHFWLRFLLGLYPRRFRERYGNDMAAAYHRMMELNGGGSPARRMWMCVRALADVALRGLAMRLRPSAGAPPERHASEDAAPTEMSLWSRDFRYAARSLLRQPLYLAASVATLALGIGATTAVFTVVHGVLLAPLPVEEPERLVRVYLEEPEAPGAEEYLTGMDAILLRQVPEALAGAAIFYDYEEKGADLTGGRRPERVRTLPVSAGYFALLGTRPVLGRELARTEEREDARVAVIGHGLWQRHFGGDPAAVGGTLRLDGDVYTVVGVLPLDFVDPVAGAIDVYVPQDLDPANGWNNWDNHYVSAVARLAPNVSLEEAGERLRATAFAANQQYRAAPEDYWLPRLVPLHEDVVGRARELLWVLLGAVGLVLLLACANVANLSLARGLARGRELAVRAALGAGRGGLARQLAAETAVVSAAGGVLGLALAKGGVSLFRVLAIDQMPRAASVATASPAVILFAAAVTALTGAAFGLLPVLRYSRPELASRLRDGERGGGRTGAVRRALVASQIAFALVLLVGAGLLAKTFVALQDVTIGIEPEGVLVFEVHLPAARYPGAAERMAFYDDLYDRLSALPVVRDAGAVHWLPVQGRGYNWGLWRADAPGMDPISAGVRVIERGYFSAAGIDLIAGRPFGPQDGPDAPLATVISRRTAERIFPSDDPLGRQLRVGGRTWTIVGVVEDVADDPTGSVSATVYFPHTQFADRHWALRQVVATSGDPLALVAPLRDVLAAIDPELVLHAPRTMDDLLAAGLARQRLAAAVMIGFAGLALALAVVGIHGVLAFLVGRRTREIGIRVALGARAGSVRAMVVRESLAVSATGIVVGLAGSLALSRWLRALLFEVEVTDPRVYAGVASGMLVVALLAAWIPARRAAAVDPVSAFRAE